MTHSHDLSDQTHKLLGLEVIRFISAVAVLIWHYQHFFHFAGKPAHFNNIDQPFYQALRLFYDYGYYGVQVFWCISGFIFFWKYRDTIAGKMIDYKTFFVLRFSRLYPLHFVTLIIVASLQMLFFLKNKIFFIYQTNDLEHFILQLFMASNWESKRILDANGQLSFDGLLSFNGPIWSISIEVLVYFFFFVILRYLGKTFVINIGVLLICLMAKYFAFTHLVFDCLAFFYAGGLSAIALRYKQKNALSNQLNIFAFLMLIIAALFAILAVPLVSYWTKNDYSQYFPDLFLFMCLPFLLFLAAQHFPVSPAIQKVIETAGNMTYSSYLIHFPIQLFTVLCFSYINLQPDYHDGGFFIGFISVTLAASYAVYRFFEAPVQNYIRNKMLG